MVYATLAGALVHAGAVAWMMDWRGYRFRLYWHGATEATREVARQYGPVLLSGVVASGGLLVDQSMAAMLPAGSVSALAYANRFVSVVITLLAGAVSSAVVPHFSRMIAHKDWAGCRHTLHTWVRLTALVSTPIALGLIAGSHLLIRAAFQHGVFGPRDTALVTPVLAMYAIQIPFFVSSRVFYRFLIAMRRSDLIFYCGALNLALDVILNLVLMRLVWRSRNRAGHIDVDREHIHFSLVLELETASARIGGGSLESKCCERWKLAIVVRSDERTRLGAAR